MGWLSWLTWALLVVAPAALLLGVGTRTRMGRKRGPALALTIGLGALAYGLTKTLADATASWAGLDAMQDRTAELLYRALVIAPLAQGLMVASVQPMWRSKSFKTPFDGLLMAVASAVGFVGARAAIDLFGVPLDGVTLARQLLALAGYPALAVWWGYALGLGRGRRLGGRLFNGSFVAAVAFAAVYEHVVFHRGPTALLAAAPLLMFVGLVSALAGRDLYKRSTRRSTETARRILRSFQPPSLTAMRDALRRTERPVMLTWIAFGALTTSGVITAALATAVAVGHSIGVDFAAVDRAESATAATAPLVLLGTAVLAGFPVAGFLVARASSSRTVLEPALSCALAIAGALILLGFAAPVAVVFAIACAPIAFALACAGAWVGLAR